MEKFDVRYRESTWYDRFQNSYVNFYGSNAEVVGKKKSIHLERHIIFFTCVMYTTYIIYISCLSAFYMQTEYFERAFSRKAPVHGKQHLCVPHIFFLNLISWMCSTDGVL